MTISQLRPAFRSYLLADASISAIVGQRIHPVIMPQGNVQPCIVYSGISDIGDHHTRGPSGLSRPRIQVDSWAQGADASANLARLVKHRLDGFRGSMGNDSPPVLEVLGLFFESERDLYDNEAKMHRVSQDYFIWHREF